MYNNIKDISILVVGFDGYIDVWNHCFDLMNKYWQDRPLTYLATSVLTPEFEGVTVIPAGPNSEWSKRAYTALQKIETPYVLLMLEDFFITDYVDNKVFSDTFELIQKNDIKFYQVLVQLLNQNHVRGIPFNNQRLVRQIPHDKKYALNLQAAIWDRKFLMDVIGPENYNAWLFEISQLHPADINKDKVQYLIDGRNILNIEHTIVQSKYLRKAIKNLRKIGCDIDPNEREVLSFKDDFKYNLKLFMYEFTPSFLVKPFKQIGKLMGIDFVTDRINKTQNGK